VTDKVAELSGKKIDVGICNHGGIRTDMPKGNVILDDILSMFPFKNNVVYLEHKGSELRKIFEAMAATYFQAIGGVEIVAEGGKLKKVLIGGEPLDDDKTYTVATISFLLYGGDSLTLAKNAENLKVYDVQIVEAVLEYIDGLKAKGKNIVAPKVTHVIVK
jgi:2',3'-cyclic-nucleotide 2'-phosphodiesterase (5'-nucleotidase family)